MTERDLLCAFKIAREERDAIKESLKDAQSRYDAAEAAIVEHLTTTNANATAKYDGIGYAQMSKPRVFASCLKENEDKLKSYLIEHKREDMIKETVPAPSLSAFVSELVEQGKPIPDLISYYLKVSVRLY